MTEYVGYIIGGPQRSGDLAIDWNEVIYTNLDAGLTELETCRAAGWWDWNLYGLTQVSEPAQ